MLFVCVWGPWRARMGVHTAHAQSTDTNTHDTVRSLFATHAHTGKSEREKNARYNRKVKLIFYDCRDGIRPDAQPSSRAALAHVGLSRPQRSAEERGESEGLAEPFPVTSAAASPPTAPVGAALAGGAAPKRR